MGVALKKLSWDDIKDFPETGGRTEIVDGELVTSPTPSRQHQQICTRPGFQIMRFLEGRDLGEFFSSPFHVILDAHVHYGPDLCFVARERLSIVQDNYVDGPPDLIIEVVSESNRTHDTIVKFRHYAEYGVREYWLVDPRENHVRLFVLQGRVYVLAGVYKRGDAVESRVLEGLRLDPKTFLS